MELPEVEVMRRDLEKDVVGKRIKEVDVRQGPNSLRIIRRHNKSGTKSARKDFASHLAGLRPDVLAVIGEFVPAIEPYRAALGDRLITAPDAAALGPILAARLSGGELVVLKGSRGVALERLLPDLAARSASS